MRTHSVPKGHAMTKKQRESRSASKHSKQVVGAASAASVARPVTPTSERIIKETSVKRRKAMKVLANR